MLSLTIHLDENTIKNYQSNHSASELCSQEKDHEHITQPLHCNICNFQGEGQDLAYKVHSRSLFQRMYLCTFYRCPNHKGELETLLSNGSIPAKQTAQEGHSRSPYLEAGEQPSDMPERITTGISQFVFKCDWESLGSFFPSSFQLPSELMYWHNACHQDEGYCGYSF